jgi:hypothetical protein
LLGAELQLNVKVGNFEVGESTVLNNEGELCVRRKWISKKEKK